MSQISRKSIHYIKNLNKNSIITKNSVMALRPGDGVSPMNFLKLLVKELKKMLKFTKNSNLIIF